MGFFGILWDFMIIKPKRDAFFAVRIRFPDDAGRWILGIPDILSIPGHHDNCNKIELQCLVFVLKKRFHSSFTCSWTGKARSSRDSRDSRDARHAHQENREKERTFS